MGQKFDISASTRTGKRARVSKDLAATLAQWRLLHDLIQRERGRPALPQDLGDHHRDDDPQDSHNPPQPLSPGGGRAAWAHLADRHPGVVRLERTGVAVDVTDIVGDGQSHVLD